MAALLVACGGASGLAGEVGTSDKVPPRASRDAGADAPVDGPGALPADYRTRFAKVNAARLVSRGHADGRWEIEVYANEAARAALASRTRAVPVGAVVVAEHVERRGEATAPGPTMVMEKGPPGTSAEHGDWTWTMVGSQGQLVGKGAIASCAGCHDAAPMDGLFPLEPAAPARGP